MALDELKVDSNGDQGNSPTPSANVPTPFQSKASKAKAEEASKAKVLFAIVALFFACNIPRTILNLEELFAQLQNYMNGSNCKYNPPYWTIIFNIFCQTILNANGAFVSVIYCVMCRTFRAEVRQRFSRFSMCRDGATLPTNQL